ncbi:hypothetical protein DFP73DRAFT_545241 [Morchella snyderi]|nr:hypothetical protein DFP73DRAFT_545241 [Morchella snyderi]
MPATKHELRTVCSGGLISFVAVFGSGAAGPRLPYAFGNCADIPLQQTLLLGGKLANWITFVFMLALLSRQDI